VGELFSSKKYFTGLTNFDSMELLKITRDSLLADFESPVPNYVHSFYQQYYKKVPILGAVFTEHSLGNNVIMTSGFLVEGLDLSTIPIINNDTAFVRSVSHINATTYEWDSTLIKPIGKLVIVPYTTEGPLGITVVYKLAWEFRVIAFVPSYDKNIYIDANNGIVLKEISNSFLGDFNHIYYGPKNDLDTRYKYVWWKTDEWYTVANDNTRNIYSTDYSGYFDPTNVNTKNWNYDDMVCSDGDDIWANDNWSATSSHYCAQKAWDYFKQTPLNRNGMTGWGRHVRVVTDASYPRKTGYIQKGSNFNSTNDYIYITRRDELATISQGNLQATYDIVGHEFTHGIIKNTSPLPNEMISGAIDESFSDIFGFMIERYMNNGIIRNWTIGEDCGTISRSMSNPNSYGGASFYLQQNFWKNPLNTSFDFGGVHYNCGVQNKWFNLLSMGGSQIINGQTRVCGGIGADKAARIAYQALINTTSYSGSNTTFDAVRANTILAAVQLYGMCSNEYNQTRAAWYAVNVGPNIIPCFINNGGNGGTMNKTSLNENESKIILNKILLFPNPSSNYITIVTEELNKNLNINDEYNVTIVDVNGKSVFIDSYKDISNLSINIEGLESGIYFVNINSNHWSKNLKFVKK